MSRVFQIPEPFIFSKYKPEEKAWLLNNIDLLLEKQSIDYDSLASTIEAERKRCMDWLLHAIRTKPAADDWSTEKSLTELTVQNYVLQKHLQKAVVDLRSDIGGIHGRIDAEKGALMRKLIEQDAQLNALREQLYELEEQKNDTLDNRIRRKISGGVKCFQEHGLIYTAKRTAYHARNLINRKK